ncbi:MAG: lipid-binding SYLF domain-containing protein [Acetobacteraceae bacterium]|nr:lipid-binding SYLF domain-containing protein [Acetobacteraceae bacterium]
MLVAAPAAWAQTDQQTVIAGARKTLGDLRHDKAFGNARTLIRQARAVLVFPKLIKGGFIVGGEGGEGVLMVRGAGGWSDPAFYAMGSASLGLQAGLQQAEVIMLVMTQKGVQGLLANEFKIGASAGISVVTLGSGVEGAIGGASLPDIVLWSSSTGLYGGLTIDGSIIRPQPDDDRAFYGRPVTTRDVLYAHTPTDRATALRRELASLG